VSRKPDQAGGGGAVKPEPGVSGSGAQVLSRRAVLACCAAAVSGTVAAGCGGAPVPVRGEAAGAHVQRGGDGTPRSAGWFAPADHVPHTRTWMAWPARADIWGAMLAGVRRDVASVARAIARFEPVAMVARPQQAHAAAAACGQGVEIVPLANDDLWMRDMGPVFLVNGRGGLAGLDMNFNGWGNKQVHPNDARIAREVLALLGVPRFTAPFTAEGGALEVDGQGAVLATESSIINPNRNPGLSKAQLTAGICGYLGARTMIWVPGLKGHDITDDHIDALARFAGPAGVIVDQPADPAPQMCGRSPNGRPSPSCASPGTRQAGCYGAASRASRRPSRHTRTRACSSTSTSTGMCATAPCSSPNSVTGPLTPRRGPWSLACTPAGRSSSSRSTTWLKEAAASTVSPSSNPRPEAGARRKWHSATSAVPASCGRPSA
jgi:Porphyromonas-type peptidyl-arginine deiminase